MSRRGWVLFASMCVLWGIPYFFIKIAVEELSPVTVVFLRTAIGAVLLLPVAAMRGQLKPVVAAWRWVLPYTVIEVTVPWLLIPFAEVRLPSSLTGLLIAAVPLVGAIVLLLTRAADRFDLRQVAGLVIGFVGVAVLVGLDDLGRGDTLSLLAMALVVIGYAVGPVIIARKLSHLPSTGVIAVSLGLTAIVSAPTGIVTWPAHPIGAPVIGAMLGLGVLCTAVAFLIFFALIAEVGPGRAQVITYVNPVVALLLGVMVLGEALTVADAVGFALILCGLLLATNRRRRTVTPESVRPGQEAALPGADAPERTAEAKVGRSA